MDNKILSSASDGVFVIGNGFDMDLGLPTSYRAFVESEFWPFTEPDKNFSETDSFHTGQRTFHQALYNACIDSRWLDIERVITEYATYNGTYNSNFFIPDNDKEQSLKDKVSYGELVKGLHEYIYSVSNTHLKANSVAARVFKAIVQSQYFSKIFSFNYTNLKFIANDLGLDQNFFYSHMHGNLNDGIILGMESKSDFCPIYRFMCKEYNMNYRTRFLNFSLRESKEIVIFGHGLGEIDYHYFEEFFSSQSRSDLTYPERKYITIFTFDTKSKMDICDQLRRMNNRRLDYLFGNNMLEIIRTDGSDEELVQNFIKRVRLKGDEIKRMKP